MSKRCDDQRKQEVHDEATIIELFHDNGSSAGSAPACKASVTVQRRRIGAATLCSAGLGAVKTQEAHRRQGYASRNLNENKIITRN